MLNVILLSGTSIHFFWKEIWSFWGWVGFFFFAWQRKAHHSLVSPWSVLFERVLVVGSTHWSAASSLGKADVCYSQSWLSGWSCVFAINYDVWMLIEWVWPMVSLLRGVSWLAVLWQKCQVGSCLETPEMQIYLAELRLWSQVPRKQIRHQTWILISGLLQPFGSSAFQCYVLCFTVYLVNMSLTIAGS